MAEANFELKIVGADFTLLEDTMALWDCSKDSGVRGKQIAIQKRLENAQSESKKIILLKNQIKGKKQELKQEKNEKRKQDLKQEIEALYEELNDQRKSSQSLIRISKFYKLLVEDIDLWDGKKLIVGHQDGVYSSLNKYSLYGEYMGERYGNLVGSVRKQYTYNEFKARYSEYFDTDEYKLDENTQNTIRIINIVIEIHSRFDKHEDDFTNDIKDSDAIVQSSYTSAPYFLLTLLTKGNLVLNNYKIPEDRENSIFDCLLLFRLREHLLEACKKGIYHTYQTFEENGTRVKGSIDFARHIKLNIGMNNGKVAYTYREKTADNYLNHLILIAYEHLKKKYPGMVADNLDRDNNVRQVLNLLKNETSFPKYDKKLVIQKCRSPIAHPYYTEYEQLRKTCHAILRNEGLSIFGGKGEDVQGILYYVPDLWEQFLESKMYGTGFKKQTSIQILHEKHRIKIRPDFIFEKEETPYMILDAKFKPMWLDFHKLKKIPFEKIGDDYDECVRYMRVIGGVSTGVIFPYLDIPENKSVDENPKRFTTSKYNSEDSFYTIPIKIPCIEQNESYSAWRKRFDENVEMVIEPTKKIIELEKEYYFCKRDIDEKLEKLANGENVDMEGLKELAKDKQKLAKRRNCSWGKDN